MAFRIASQSSSFLKFPNQKSKKNIPIKAVDSSPRSLFSSSSAFSSRSSSSRLILNQKKASFSTNVSTKKSTQTQTQTKTMTKSEAIMKMESDYGAHNYHPLPVVFSKASGADVWDPEGKHYYDFLSAYSAVNQGHCHPRIVNKMIEQAQKLTLSSRAFYNDAFGPYAKFVTEYFGFEMVLPMNTGAEGVETAIKLARKWGYMKKKIPENEAIIVCCSDNFHGRTIAIISMSNDPDNAQYGPYLPGIKRVTYNDAGSLEKVLNEFGPKVAGFIVEPIQGEAGVVVPDDGYLKKCYDLCKKHNVLFIADEIQTGVARTGKMLCCDWDGVKPDILILGKALSGGFYPVSAVLSSKEIMLCIKPGQHGSTYGGNALACAIAMEALQVVKDENLVENARVMGDKFRKDLRAMNNPLFDVIRGRGLLNAIVVKHGQGIPSAWDICLKLKDNGLLAKPTHDHIIRLAPPLVMTEKQINECVDIIKTTFDEAAKSANLKK